LADRRLRPYLRLGRCPEEVRAQAPPPARLLNATWQFHDSLQDRLACTRSPRALASSARRRRTVRRRCAVPRSTSLLLRMSSFAACLFILRPCSK
jgi:hypothetical protein